MQGTQRVQASLLRVQQSNAQLRAQLKNVLEEDAASTPVVQPMSYDFDQLDEDNDEHDDKNGDEEHDNDVVSSDGGEQSMCLEDTAFNMDASSASVPVPECNPMQVVDSSAESGFQVDMSVDMSVVDEDQPDALPVDVEVSEHAAVDDDNIDDSVVSQSPTVR